MIKEIKVLFVAMVAMMMLTGVASAAEPTFTSASATSDTTIEILFSENIAIVGTPDWANDVTATGITASGGTVSDATLIVTVVSLGDTAFTAADLAIAAGTVMDVATTTNNAAISAEAIADGQAPAVTALAVSPATGTAKIGDTITLDITADAAGYTASAITVNGVDVTTSNFVDAGAGSYTVDYVVAEGDSDVAEGVITASVILSDAASNLNTAFTTVDANTLLIDANSPTIAINTVTSPTNTDYQIVAGTIEDGAIVVECSTATVGSVTYPTSTTWSVAIIDMSEGDNVITATATDLAGNTREDTATILVDITAPDAPVITLTDPINLANEDIVEITGTGEADAEVYYEIHDDTGYIDGAGTVDGSGNILVTGIDVSVLDDGILTAYVCLIDEAGNIGGLGEDAVIKDTVAPTVAIDPVTSPTNTNYQIVAGTIEDGATVVVECSTATATVGSVTYPTSTTWSVAIIDMGEGDNVITATATDLVGNEASDEDTILVDITVPIAPDIAMTDTINIANEDAVEITGTGEADAEVYYEIWDDTGYIDGAGTVDGSGNISVTGINVSSLDDGELTAYVWLVDEVGNAGAEGTAVATKDTVPPDAPVITLLDPINIANVAAVTIIGTGEAYAEVCIDIYDTTGNLVDAAGTVDLNGNISVTGINVSSLNDSELTAYVWLVDAAGNEGAEGIDTATKDTVAPTVMITSTAADPTNTSPIPMTVTFSESVTGFTVDDIVVVNGTKTSFAGSAADYTFEITATGEVLVTANIAANMAVDTATNGNIVAAEYSINFDDVAPDAPVITLTDPINLANEGIVEITGTGEAGADIYFEIWDNTGYIDGTEIVDGSGNISVTGIDVSVLDDGILTAYVCLIDEAGNIGGLGEDAVIKDTVAPTVAIDPVTSPTNTDSQTVTSTIEDWDELEVECLTADVGIITEAGTTWSVNITNMSEGDNVITATATDLVGNTASDTATIVFDDVAPTITIDAVTSPTNTLSQTVTGNVDDWEGVMVDCPTATVGIVNYQDDLTGSLDIFNVTGEPIAIDTAAVTGNMNYNYEGDPMFTLDFTGDTGDGEVLTFTGTAADSDEYYRVWPLNITIINETGVEFTATGEAEFTESGTMLLDFTCVVPDGDEFQFIGEVTFADPTIWSVDITGMDEGDNVIIATATDLVGNTASDTATILIDTVAPIANAGPDQIIILGDTVQFNGSDSYDPDAGTIISYSWDFGDDSGISTDAEPSHKYDGEYGEYTVTLTVTDIAGNTGTDTMTVTHGIKLNAGWNLVSTPLIPDNASIEVVLSDVDDATIVWEYDADTSSWLSYIPGAGGSLAEIKAGNGYWIDMSDADTLVIPGTYLEEGPNAIPTYPVYEGWNLIGVHSLDTCSAETYLSSTSSNCAYVLHGFQDGAWVNVDLFNGDLVPGYGYWAYMTEDGAIAP